MNAQTSPGLVISGEVRIGDEPADSGTVVLHRVSTLFSGEVDSVSVRSDGRFEFIIPVPRDPLGNDVYFASLRYQGILYFGACQVIVHRTECRAIAFGVPPNSAIYVNESQPSTTGRSESVNEGVYRVVCKIIFRRKFFDENFTGQRSMNFQILGNPLTKESFECHTEIEVHSKQYQKDDDDVPERQLCADIH